MNNKIFLSLLLMCYCFAIQAQNHDHTGHDHEKHDHAAHEHEKHDHIAHPDSTYHCGMCDKHLFNVDEATVIDNKELHYHGIATDDSKTPFHCAACKGHLGYYDHEHTTYQVINSHTNKKHNGTFHCLSCQLPIFDQKDLTSSDDRYSYFREPIDKERIALEERNKFYSIKGSNVTCAGCNSRIGEVNKNDSGGFGMRLNLRGVKKKERRQ